MSYVQSLDNFQAWGFHVSNKEKVNINIYLKFLKYSAFRNVLPDYKNVL